MGGRYTQNGFDPTPDEEIDDLALRKYRNEQDEKKNNVEIANSRRSMQQRSIDNKTVRMYIKGRQRGNVSVYLFLLVEVDGTILQLKKLSLFLISYP